MIADIDARGKLSHIERPVKDDTGKVIRYERIKVPKPETEVLPGDTLHVAPKWFGD